MPRDSTACTLPLAVVAASRCQIIDCPPEATGPANLQRAPEPRRSEGGPARLLYGGVCFSSGCRELPRSVPGTCSNGNMCTDVIRSARTSGALARFTPKMPAADPDSRFVKDVHAKSPKAGSSGHAIRVAS